MVLLLANGAAGNRAIASRSREYDEFVAHLTALCLDLAYQIVADGEGATRVFRVRVRGAANVRDADAVGRAVVNSPLVKAAVHGGDPNWGRIVTAAANSGAKLRGQGMSLSIGPGADKKGGGEAISVFRRGTPEPRDAATQRRLEKLMAGREVVFTLELGMGRADVEWLGCDLSREYVRINADYTT
jgi:glutamate N-acetyltransferase / amino-acid N-acetyltransferase